MWRRAGQGVTSDGGRGRWTPVALLSFAVLAASCASGTTTTPSRSSSPESSSFSPTPIQIPPIPEGTYEYDVTRKDWARVGNCGTPEDVDENTGHATITFRNGRFRSVLSADHPISQPLSSGVYSGAGHVVTLTFDTNTADLGIDTLRWSFDGKYLRFRVLRVTPDSPNHLCAARIGYQSHPWLKTG
jgi:hypothetical protein